MKNLESRLNELEKTLTADNEQGLPYFMYMSSQGDSEQVAREKELEAFERYKADNVEKYPQLKTMTLADLYEQFKNRKDSPVIHVEFVDYAEKGGVV